MRVLVACEESQAVCKAFRLRGHEAYSCDLQECSGGRPEWHIQCDVLSVLDQGWDLMIGHPTCTFLTNSGVCWLYNKDGSLNIPRWESLEEGAKFFNRLLNCPVDKIAIENPIPHKYALNIIGRKYDQLVQPWMFGHTESKATCLWLKGLPKLQETDNVRQAFKALPAKEAQRLHYLPPSKDRAKLRSKTYEGIANAMAEQWG